MAKNTAFFLSAVLGAVMVYHPLQVKAQVYRCEGPTGLVYSQIPCEADAEPVKIQDPVIEAEERRKLREAKQAEAARREAAAKRPTPMENFIATLHHQREQQVGELDENIELLQLQLSDDGEEELDQETRDSLGSRLAALQSERVSVVAEYEALIAEAESRDGTVVSAN